MADRRPATTPAPLPLLLSLLCLWLAFAACGPVDEEGSASTESVSTAAAPDAADTDADPSADDDPLAGTEWQLVEVQSMDDAIGTTTPDERSDYTLTLNADGTASLRLDCNQGTGPWTAEAASGGDSGSIEFGDLAVTRALCPPPSLGEQLAAQLPYVRSYLLRDGRLNLSLMADGGILVWEPVRGDEPDPEDPTTGADPILEAAILDAAPDYTIAAEAPATIGDRLVTCTSGPI